MRRAGNLYPAMYDLANVRLAHIRAQKGKRHYREVRMVNRNPNRYCGTISKMLKEKTFQNSPYVKFQRVEGGKRRHIFKLPYYPDRIVHHCIMNILEPIWMKTFIRDTFASMKGRGIHDGVKRMKVFLADKAGTRYCLKLDISKFYPSIDHDILKQIIRRRIKCRDTLWLLDHIIDSADGVPIGNYLSQYFGNLYLTYFDHWIKEVKRIRYYARYCDDIVVLHPSKQALHGLFREITDYLRSQLRLAVKHNWQIFPTRKRGIDFLGYRFFGSHTLVRKSIARTFKRKSTRLLQRPARNQDINALMSYYGWLKHADGRNLWEAYADSNLKRHIAMCGGPIPKHLEAS